MKNVMYSVGLMVAVVLAGVNVFFVVQDGNDLVGVKMHKQMLRVELLKNVIL